MHLFCFWTKKMYSRQAFVALKSYNRFSFCSKKTTVCPSFTAFFSKKRYGMFRFHRLFQHKRYVRMSRFYRFFPARQLHDILGLHSFFSVTEVSTLQYYRACRFVYTTPRVVRRLVSTGWTDQTLYVLYF